MEGAKARSIWVEPYHFHYYSAGCTAHPPILFLHGFMGNCYEFDGVIATLSQQFYCVAVDLPGHGNSAVISDVNYSMKRTAEGLIRFLDALQIRQCCLVGYSMGGRLALYLTLHFPQYFLKVALESASPGLKTQAEQQQRKQRDLERASQLEEDFSAFLENWYSQPLFAEIKAHPTFNTVFARRLQNNPFTLAKSLQYLGTGCQPSLWQALNQNTVPGLLIVGERDQKFVRINTEMAAQCRFFSLEIIDRCGHTIHLENPDRFTQKLLSFLLAN